MMSWSFVMAWSAGSLPVERLRLNSRCHRTSRLGIPQCSSCHPIVQPSTLPIVSFDRQRPVSLSSWHGTEASAEVLGTLQEGYSQVRRLYILKSLIHPHTVSSLLEAAREGVVSFQAEPDTVDASASYLAVIIQDGKTIDQRLASMLQPYLDECILPYVRQRYGCSSCVVADALVRRYLPDERTSLGRHFGTPF